MTDDTLASVASLTIALALGFELRNTPGPATTVTVTALAAELERRGELDAMLAGLPGDRANALRLSIVLHRASARFSALQTHIKEA